MEADFEKLERGCRMIHADVPPFFGFGLEDGHVPPREGSWTLLGSQSLGP